MPVQARQSMRSNSFPQQNNGLISTNKNLPQNIDAEKSVLAACMLEENAIVDIATKLTPDTFFRPQHQIIFSSMLDLYSRNIPVDQISVKENLQGTGQLDAVGGMSYLLELADNTFALTNWQSHADVVKRTSMLRELAYASVEINALAYDAPDDIDEVVELAERSLFNVTEKRVTSDFTRVYELLSGAFEEITSLSNNENKLVGVGSGFRDVDELFHGFRTGDLIIIAARPGVGKTAFALNMAVNAAKLGTTVAFMSLEMSSAQLAQRILCSEARIDLQRIRSGNVQDSDWGAIIEAANTLSKLDLYIDDTPSLSILELRAKARRQLRNVENGLIIVDYLQLMQPQAQRRDSTRAVEVGEISRGLKILAKEMNMPVIALSQLSRMVEMRSDKRPQLSDLRESGSIEQDADIVMFIDRSKNDEEAEANDRPKKGEAHLIVAKHRNGPTRDITLSFNANYTRFMDHYDDSRLQA